MHKQKIRIIITLNDVYIPNRAYNNGTACHDGVDRNGASDADVAVADASADTDVAGERDCGEVGEGCICRLVFLPQPKSFPNLSCLYINPPFQVQVCRYINQTCNQRLSQKHPLLPLYQVPTNNLYTLPLIHNSISIVNRAYPGICVADLVYIYNLLVCSWAI